MGLKNLDRLDAIIEPMLHAAKIPGAAIAVVAAAEVVFAKGYGYRILDDMSVLSASGHDTNMRLPA